MPREPTDNQRADAHQRRLRTSGPGRGKRPVVVGRILPNFQREATKVSVAGGNAPSEVDINAVYEVTSGSSTECRVCVTHVVVG